MEERSCDAGLGAMSAPSPPPPRPPLPPPGVDQSAWPAPPKCPGSALCDASGADMKREAPKVFDVVFHTTTGDVRVRAWRDLAPAGADRLYNLARLGYYDASPLYRVLPGFVAQFGVAADPSVSAVYDWRRNSPGAILPDEPNHASSSGNAKHWISYSASYDAATGRATNRTAELFINLADNTDRLDAKGFAAFAKVVDGVKAVDGWFAGYGEMRGACHLHGGWGGWVCDGPEEGELYARGVGYVDSDFPALDRIGSVDVDVDPSLGDVDDGVEHLSHLGSHSATSWLAIATVCVCGIGAWVRSRRWQRAKRERPDLEDDAWTHRMNSQRQPLGMNARGPTRARDVEMTSPAAASPHHSRHGSVQISRQGSMQSLASQGAPMGSELRGESSGSL